MSTPLTPRAVLVTTEYGGVFFGYAIHTDGEAIHLRRCRNCIFWDSTVGGFLGLASVGPNAHCRIGAQADFTVRKVTGVAECTPQAVDAWERAAVCV